MSFRIEKRRGPLGALPQKSAQSGPSQNLPHLAPQTHESKRVANLTKAPGPCQEKTPVFIELDLIMLGGTPAAAECGPLAAKTPNRSAP
jgi:hypothetical protein